VKKKKKKKKRKKGKERKNLGAGELRICHIKRPKISKSILGK